MFWADRIAKEIIDSGKYKPYWVDDMKTPSGFAHVGSLMGPVVHSMIYRSLKDAGVDATYTFIVNNMDPVDGLSEELKEEYSQYMGYPLMLAPSPDPKFKSMAEYYADDFVSSIRSLGVEPEILYSWDFYKAGKFDGVIKEALDNAEKIQDIYQKVSGSNKKQKGWLPFQVICENCSKLGTTRVYAWDGKEVSYKCEPSMVKWAQGCSHEGKISPFGGTGKLPWKVDWPAHWKVIGVTIEGAGKDHASAGGSYDIAMTIVEEVFSSPKPFKLPYEFILIGGRKMSSSKGLGLKAHDLVKIVPPELGRFLFARTDIKKQSNFDPVGTMAIPDLFDDYDAAWNSYVTGDNEDSAKMFVLSQIKAIPEREKIFLPRFRDVASYMQHSSVDVFEKIEELKGSKLNADEINVLEERIAYAKIWLKNYAPEEDVVELQKTVPAEVAVLTEYQRKYLLQVIELLDQDHTPEELQVKLYDAAKEVGITTKEAFAAMYLSLIGKSHGPKAAWFIKANKDFTKKRFKEVGMNDIVGVSENVHVKTSGPQLDSSPSAQNDTIGPDVFMVDPKVSQLYPSISIGIAVIKGVTIAKSDPELEKEKEELLNGLADLTTEQLGEFSEIKSYRKLYKEMGVDWHSRRPSPEALLRRVALKKGLYSVNTCVDAYNLIVMKNKVSIGAFDLDKIAFPTVLRFPKYNEEILLLGDDSSTFYKEKELSYFDQTGGYNIDFNFRDAQRTAVQMETKNLYINVDGIFDITPNQVEETLREACEIILRYCGGKVEMMGVVTAK